MNRSASTLRHARINPILFGVILLVLVIAATGVIYLLTPKGMPAEQAQRLLKLSRLANGFLENEDEYVGLDAKGETLSGYLEADKRFTELQEELPNEILPFRNQAVCRVLYFGYKEKDLDEPIRTEWLDKTAASIATLKEREKDSPVPWILGAFFQKAANGGAPNEAMLDELRVAQQKDPSYIASFYLFYEASVEVIDGEELEEERNEALKKCYAIAPENISVAKDYFIFLAENKDPQLAKVLTDAKELILSLGRLTEIEAGENQQLSIANLYHEAIAKIDEEDWRTVNRNVRQIRNVLNPTGAQKSDRKKVSPRELEYMLTNLSDKFYENIKTSKPDSKNWDGQFDKPSRIVDLENITDLHAISFDLDPIPELIVVADNQLSVFEASQAKSDSDTKWESILKQDLGGEFDSVLCADLDRDNKGIINPSWKDRFQFESPGALNELPADIDFIVFGNSGFKVFTNEAAPDGTRSLVEIPQSPETNVTGVTAGTLIDIDTDSDLDLVLAAAEGIKVLLNPGDGVFGDYSSFSILPDGIGTIESISIADWDRDVDVDMIVNCENGIVGLLENLRHGRFRWTPLTIPGSTAEKANSLHIIEFDGNVSWDILRATNAGIELTKSITAEAQRVKLQETRVAAASIDGLHCADFNNDMNLDIAAWNSDGVEVFAGQLEAGFGTAPNAKFDLADVNFLRTADFDLDGFVEILVARKDGIDVIENQQNENHWLTLFPVGADTNSNISGRVNHHGIGSLVEINTGGRYQAQMVTSPTIHFGTGETEKAVIVRILWTYGMPQVIIQPETNQFLRELMFDKGSCPFIYTWNGQEFQFFTDCLWAAPIGLQAAEGVLVPTREWEYLKVPGEVLKPKNGYYELKVTEELWEAAYFDHLQLIAVDHPESIDIFTNEKVGPPTITQHKIFRVADKRQPVAASDRYGNDVLSKLAKEDGDYCVPFKERIFKGLTPMHHLELDLGNLKDAKEITLFLTGWIRPTDSSTNIGFSQNPNLENPKSPEVWVQDENQQWKLAIAPMGFPGGKTKTIAVDLSNAFLCDNYKIQIRTSNEIYWDHAFFAVDEPDHEIKTFEMDVERADLQYRGFSHRFFPDQNSPELFDYTKLTTSPRWPPMRGKFTRYGDVTELLTKTDDQMAVIGSGDEISISFKVPNEPITAGWTRDFILHCVGYDKDADLNTVYGQTAEPLPFRAMKSYPYGAEQSFPQSPEHRNYLKEYQTRVQSWDRFWRDIQRPKQD